jgi:hypothetical protein
MDTPCAAVQGIEVKVVRHADAVLELHYFVTGAIKDVRIPRVSEPQRTDRLWEHSCCEAFVRSEGQCTYHEINLSPSREWAAYRFGGYRSGMQVPPGIAPPVVGSRITAKTFVLHAHISLAGLPGLRQGAPWQLGLSAVIEETSGAKSYWALAHPPGKPDFHHDDCFARLLPPPEAL